MYNNHRLYRFYHHIQSSTHMYKRQIIGTPLKNFKYTGLSKEYKYFFLTINIAFNTIRWKAMPSGYKIVTAVDEAEMTTSILVVPWKPMYAQVACVIKTKCLCLYLCSLNILTTCSEQYCHDGILIPKQETQRY